MDSRERVLTALDHQEADRVPIDLGGTICSGIHRVAYEKVTRHLGLSTDTSIVDLVQQLAAPSEEILQRFSSDFRPVYMRPPKTWTFQEHMDETGRPYFTDEWGIKWGKNPYYYDMIDHPLKQPDIKAIEKHPWPDANAPGRLDGVREEARKLRRETDYAIVAGISGPVAAGLFEQAWFMRGFQNFMTDMMIRPEFTNRLLDRIQDVHIDFYEKYLDAVGEHVDIIEWGDDYGMQTGPLLSPALFTKYFKHRDKEFLDFVKSKTDAKIFWHTCGSVYPFINDLVEAGVDILNPVQPLAANMDHGKLKAEFGGRLCFHGGLDIQKTLPRGSQEEVARGVKAVLKNLATKGGYVFASAHNIQADVPPENIIAMFEAAREYGQYPFDF